MTAEAPLAGRTALIVELGLPLLGGMAEGLEDAGATVATLRGLDVMGGVMGDAEAIRAALNDVLGETVPALVVLSLLGDASTAIRSVEATDLTTWRAAAIQPIRTAMRVLTVLGERMKPAGEGAVVFLAPSLSLVGGASLVGLSTMLEGQRGLMKSVARQWGASGVTVNWVAAAPRALSSHFDAADLAAKGDAVPIALGRRPDARAEIASLAGWLAGPGGRGVTGATLMMDGGEWMVP